MAKQSSFTLTLRLNTREYEAIRQFAIQESERTGYKLTISTVVKRAVLDRAEGKPWSLRDQP